MIVSIGICPNDQSQALNLAQWITELGGAKGHSALLVYDSRCNPTELQAELDKSFDEVKTVSLVDSLSRWPMSANLTFSTAARHVEAYYPQARYWLFLEPDAIPLRPGAFDALAAEYERARRPFMGARVEVDGVPLHMSGNAIWPVPLHKYAGQALIAHEIAFDVQAAPEIVSKAHWTELIAHSWDRDYNTGQGLHRFDSWSAVVDQVLTPHPNAVLYHGDKSGTLIDRLREDRKAGEHDAKRKVEEEKQKDQNQGVTVELTTGADKSVQAAPAQLTCDIFIKTYPADYEWLSYCLRSIDKFCSGFRRVVIVSPETNSDEFKKAITGCAINILPIANPNEIGDGYLFQQSVKLHADEYTEADWILMTDSDTLFTCQVTPQTYFRAGNPIWMMTPYEETETPWKPIVEKFIGHSVEFEFMRRLPFLLPRWLLQSLRQFCIEQHRMPMHTYISNQPSRSFSEFNVIGVHAFERHHDKFAWINTGTVEGWPTLTVRQFRSFDGITKENKEIMETILTGRNGGDNRKAEPKGASHSFRSATKLTGPGSIPGAPRQLDNGVWVCGTTHHALWCEKYGLIHDKGMEKLLKAHINKGDVVVNIGAHIGSLARVAVDQGAKVIAFEPNDDARYCLQRNVPEANIYGVALSDHFTFVTLKKDDDNAGATWIDFNTPGIIPALRLDDYKFEKLNFLIIDAEGSECRILCGAEETLKLCKPLMLIEVNKTALERHCDDAKFLFQWLREHDYDVHQLAGDSENDPQFDILCKPIEKFPENMNETRSQIPLSQDFDYRVMTIVCQLKQLCTNPTRTGKVRKELRAQKVIR